MDLDKKRIAVLIPYRKEGGLPLIFLQKRSANDPGLPPGYFAFFGGHAEGDESPEQTMLREIKEELNYIPSGYKHLGQYEFSRSRKNIYYVEVGDQFEHEVNVREGEYGRFFNEEQASNELQLIHDDRVVLKDLFAVLTRGQEN